MKSKFLKKAGAVLLSATMLTNTAAFSTFISDAADSTETRYEFEDAEITGTGSIKTDDAEASGGAYYFLEGNSDTATLKVTVETTGMYELSIRYAAAYGEKIQNLYVNGVDQGQISFTSKTWADANCGSVKLNAGENEIMIKGNWGWTNFDYLTVKPATLPDIKVTQPYTCDTKATIETQNLMSYLSEVYGNNIISGQQEIYMYGPHDFEYEFEYLKDTTGHYPAIRGFDYLNEANILGYGTEDGTTDRIIDWVKNRNGIATASWHLTVPVDFTNYNVGDSVTYENATYSCKWDTDKTKGNTATNFNTANVVKEGTKENEYYLAALEELSTYLLKLQDANVPLIFRPLHEAEGSGGETGSWFWWGAAGSEVYKEIWKLTYKTLTEDYGIHNIIWEWNSYNYENSANWYPGDDYVDIIGYDKYNCTVYLEENNWQPSLVHNDSAISSTFYGIMQKYGSAKMVSMAENDSFSTVDNLMSEKAGWLYFCTWYDGDQESNHFLTNPLFNTKEDTIAMYQSDYCITLDELPADLYTKNGEVTRTTAATTTTTTTTADPSVTTTTTTTGFTFEQKSYKIDLPEDRTDTDLVLEIEGAPTASIGGGVGYGTNAKDWTNLEWSGNADADGKLTIKVDISEIPSTITTAEIQIWWSNVWDSTKEAADDADCDLVKSSFVKRSSGTVLYGDANCDDKVDLSDAVMLLQAIANEDKYGVNGTSEDHITAQGLINGDCADPGSGVTALDALSIQKYIAEICTLPVYTDNSTK